MTLQVRLFAGVAEAYGQDHLVLEWQEALTASSIKQLILESYPTLRPIVERCLVAVNRVYAEPDVTIAEHDEIALIPPVGGGADNAVPAGTNPFSLLTENPLDVSVAFACLSDVNRGGTVIFSGTVRELTGKKLTSHLEYEAYQAMALAEMQKIQSAIEEEFPGTKTLCWHRLGTLVPSELAVICGAAAPHRNEAFLAARALIDRVKQHVPIWKKEYYRNGTATWQENHENSIEL